MEYEDILVNLKVLEKVQINEKLHSRGKYLNVEYVSVVPVSIRRWLRQDTRDEMLKKISTWGHNKDRNWVELVEEEFSREFNGTDFIHGYTYKILNNFIL